MNLIDLEGGDLLGSKNIIDQTTYGLKVQTSMHQFLEFYSVTIEFKGLVNYSSVSKTCCVGKFVDVKGMFDEYRLELEVGELY